MSVIADLIVRIGADPTAWAELKQAFDDAKQGMTSTGDAAASAGAGLEQFQEKTEGLTQQMNLFADATKSAVDDVNSQLSLFDTSGIDALDSSFGSIQVSAQDSIAPIQEIGEKAKETGSAFEGLGESAKTMLEQFTEIAALAGVSVTLAGIAKDAITAYSNLQLAQVALSALTGSASGAADTLEHLKTVAQADALSFPQLISAEQRMTAFGFTTSQASDAIEALANASKATNNSFEAVANSLERIAASGTVTSRTLVQLGLTTDDLAKSMGVADDKVKTLFQSDDMAQRIDILTDALDKFSGIAAASAETVAGAWTRFQNELDFAFEDIGRTTAPILIELITDLQDVIPVVQELGGVFLSFAASQISQWIESIKAVVSATGELNAALNNLYGLTPGMFQLSDSFIGFYKNLQAIGTLGLTELPSLIGKFAEAESYLAGANSLMAKSVTDVGKGITDSMKAATEGAIDLDQMLLNFQQKQRDAESAKAAAAASAAQAQALASAQAQSAMQEEVRLSLLAADSFIKQVDAIQKLETEAGKLDQEIPADLSSFQDKVAAGFNFDALEKQVQAFLDKMKDAGQQGSDAYNQLDADNQTLQGYMVDTMYGMDRVGQAFQAAQVKADDAMGKMIAKMETMSALKPADQLTADLKTLGITLDGLSEKADADLDAFNRFAAGNVQNASSVEEAWRNIQKAIANVASDPDGMAKILEAEKNYQAALIKDGASLQAQQQALVNILETNLKNAEAHGRSADAVLQIGINLDIAKAKQTAFNDQLTGSLTLFNNMTTAIGAAWTQFGSGIADAITGSQSFGQAMTKVLDDLEKKVTELAVNFLLGQLKDAFIQNTNVLEDFGKAFSNVFGSAGKTVSGAVGGGGADSMGLGSLMSGGTQAASAGAGLASIGSGVLGMMSQLTDMVGSIGTLITGIIQVIQNMKIEKTLGLIEESTRRLDISYEGAGLTYAFDTLANTGDILSAFNGWFHDAFASLMTTTEDIDSHMIALAQAGLTVSSGSTSGSSSTAAPSLGSPTSTTDSSAGADQMAQAMTTLAQSTNSVQGFTTAIAQATTSVSSAATQASGALLVLSEASLGNPLVSSSNTPASAGPTSPNPGTGVVGSPTYAWDGKQWVQNGTVAGVASTGNPLDSSSTTPATAGPTTPNPTTGIAGSPSYSWDGKQWVQTGTVAGTSFTPVNAWNGAPSGTVPAPTLGLPSSFIGQQSGAVASPAAAGGMTVIVYGGVASMNAAQQLANMFGSAVRNVARI